MSNYFTKADIDRVMKLLATITKEARFERSVDGFITLYNDLDWVKRTILPKMEAHLVDDIKITQKQSPEKEEK